MPTDYRDSEYQEAVQDAIARNEQKKENALETLIDRILETHDPITKSELWKELERQADDETGQ